MKVGCFARSCQYVKSLLQRFKENIVNFALEIKKLGKDDPRRIYHALKVGFAITVVSLYYYFQPIYDGFGVNAMWAVMTVVVVFEYTVGATLGKGINRIIATCVAGFLGILAHYVADHSGKTGEPILLALFGFIVASIMTFMRFLPKLKAKYDYGLMIFILTFALVTVSGYRDDEVLKMANQRFFTVLIGCFIVMLICVLISPVWTGTELHNTIASNIQKLGIFLEGFGTEYLKTTTDGKAMDKSKICQYKSFLGTKSTEESMVNFASWEPAHGKFKYRHPWKQYLKIGALTRQCGYRLDALDNYLNSYNQQSQREIQENIKDTCAKLSCELGKLLKEVASGVEKMKKTSTKEVLLADTNSIGQELKTLLQDTSLSAKLNVLEIIPAATVASILIEIVDCVENIVDEVHELASMAKFKSMETAVVAPEKKLPEIIGPHHVVTIDVGEDATNHINNVAEQKPIQSAESEIKN